MPSRRRAPHRLGLSVTALPLRHAGSFELHAFGFGAFPRAVRAESRCLGRPRRRPFRTDLQISPRAAIFVAILNLVLFTCGSGSPLFGEGLYCPIVSYSQAHGAGTSHSPTYNRDGSLLAFSSVAPNLAAGDTNGFEDVLLLDKTIRAFSIVSRAAGEAGELGNGVSSHPDLTRDGRYAAFLTRAGNLANEPSPYNPVDWDVVLRDLVTHQNELIDVSEENHVVANRGVLAIPPRVSANGCRVVFSSQANNLVSDWPDPPTTLWYHAFLRDRCEDRTVLLSRPVPGQQSNGHSAGPVISADGRYVAFTSSNDRLPGVDSTPGDIDVFVYDVESQEIVQRLDFDSVPGGVDASLSIDRSGQFLVGISSAQKSTEDTNSLPDAYVVEIETGLFELISVNSDGSVGAIHPVGNPSISEDARFVAFQTQRDLTGELDDADIQVWIRDLELEETRLISKHWQTGTGSTLYAAVGPRIAPSGALVAFQTHANLDPRDTSFQFAQLYEGTGGAVDFLDANVPELNVGGVLTTDPNRLAAFGRYVRGVAADGVSPVLLRFRSTSEGTVRFTIADEDHSPSPHVGTLSSVGGSEHDPASLDVPTIKVNAGEHFAFAVLSPPEAFDRPAVLDDAFSKARQFYVQAQQLEFAGAYEIGREIVRPPVTLVHGLWSNSATWEYAMLDVPWFDLSTHSYGPSNSWSFHANQYVGLLATWDAVRRLRNQGYAATQVDYVGHSMGGILGRQWVAGDHCHVNCNSRAQNFFEGDVNRLITIGTPHAGSELADVLSEAYPEMSEIQRWFFNTSLGCVICGAVDDLRTYSDETSSFRAATVPSHAMVGTGGQESPPLLLRLLLDQAEVSFEEIFGIGVQHDAVVSRLSQEGGLTGEALTLVGPSPTTRANHRTEPKEDAFGDVLEGLLKAPAGSSLFNEGGFPAANGTLGMVQVPGAGIGSLAQMDFGGPIFEVWVESSGPYFPGDNVTLYANGSEGFEPRVFVLVLGEMHQEFEQLPWDSTTLETTFTIPMTAEGELPYGAIALGGYINPGNPEIVLSAIGEPPISVGADYAVVALSVEPDEIIATPAIPGRHVSAYGIGSDGVARILEPASVDFSSLDSAVASVSSDGFVRFHQVGLTSIVSSFDGLSRSTPVVVAEQPLSFALMSATSNDAYLIVDKLLPPQGITVFGTSDAQQGTTPVEGCPRLDLGLASAVKLLEAELNDPNSNHLEFSVPFFEGEESMILQVVTNDCTISPSLFISRSE